MAISSFPNGWQRVCFGLAASAVITTPVFAQSVLSGGVSHTDMVGGPSHTTLQRSEVHQTDNFAAPPATPDLEQAFAPGNFNVATMAPPPPPPAFNLNAASEGSMPDFQGQQGMPTLGQQQPPSNGFNLGAQQSQPQMTAPADPDSTPEMTLLWDAWHRRVAEAVFIRYSSLANAAFANSPPIGAIAAYTVSRDGHISNVHLTQKSANVMYNGIVLMAIQSLNGNMAVLQFPPNSRRMTVEKQGQFTQNYGTAVGFKNVMGDHETIPGRR